MASDARAMLRAARDARKISHPHASYAGGNLNCTICRTVVKAEAHWESHLRSAQHIERVKASKKADTALPNRKRKAEDDNGQQDEVKRSRVVSAEPEAETGAAVQAQVEENTQLKRQEDRAEHALAAADKPAEEVDEDEWDAFERDMKVLESEPAQQIRAQAASGAVISAAPVSAEEIAAQAREAQSQQRGQREEELEAEGEEAEARTNEEAEEMQRLEDRMRQLRERREALKKLDPKPEVAAEEENADGEANGEANGETAGSDDSGSDDEDDWENFGFRRR